jgi:hypothetical protein
MSWLGDLLQGIPLNAVLKERMALVEQKLKDTEEKNKALEGTVADLTAENERLKKQISHAPMAAAAPAENPKFVGSGYMFDGDDTLYCPACFHRHGKKHPMSLVGSMGAKCTVCGNITHH